VRRVKGPRPRERFPTKESLLMRKKGGENRGKQEENERKKILKSSLFLPSLSIFIFFSAFFQ